MTRPFTTKTGPRAAQPPLAKLTRPRSDGLVPRERLFIKLDAARQVPLVWLAAPPGSGKTSLLASYLGARMRPVAWMQVDAADADPATFFHYLTMAAAALTDRVPPLPVFAPQNAAQPAQFARRYFREWFAIAGHAASNGAAADTVLVLDNIQDAGDAPSWHAMLVAMVEETPAGVQTIALSRVGLPAELTRARLARQVTTLEWQDLKLQRDEATALVANAGGAEASGAEASAAIDQLFELSQGWAAGLVLLLERLRQSGALQREAFAGSLEAVFDYFAAQVFDASPQRVQDTLMRLSFLQRMNGANAAELSGDGQAAKLLDDLARRNLFIDRRLGDEIVYQFHALFRAFLQARARQRLGHEECLRCGLLGAQILRRSGQPEDAVRLYLDAGEWAAAASLGLEHAEALIRTGRHQTLAEWIGALPKPLRDADPWLVYWLGVARVARVGRDPAMSRVLIERALAAFDLAGDSTGQVRAIASLMSGWWAERASLRWLEPYASRLNALLHDNLNLHLDLNTRAIGLISLARARLMIRPDDPLLADYAMRLAALPIDKLAPELGVGIGTCLVAYYWGVGDSEACTAAIRRSQATAERSDVPVSDRLWFWFWQMTHLVYLADVDGGREVMRRARELHDASGQSPPFADFVRWDVTLELQMGRPDRARRMLETELVPLLADASLSTQACIDLEQARCAIEEQRLGDAVAHALRGVKLCDEGGLGWLRTSLGLTLSCAQALAGQCDEAHATLQDLRAHVGPNLRILCGSIETYQALVHLQSGQLDAARRSLDQAMQLRSVTTYPWGPGWNRPGVARVVAFALQEGRHVPAMQRIAQRLRLAPPSPDVEHWPWAARIKVLDGFSLHLGPSGSGSEAQRAAVGKASHRLLELLKALSALGGNAVPADELAETIWPDSDGDQARRSLDTGLSRLRKLLQCDDVVTVHDGKVSLHPHRVSLDLRAFEHQRQQMREARRGSEPWLRAAERALTLYRQPLLAGEHDAPWLIDLRSATRLRWLEVVRSVVEQCESDKDPLAVRRVTNDAVLIDANALRKA